MKVHEMKVASTTELLARYARVRIDARRFEALTKKAKDERAEIYREITSNRRMQTGHYMLDGKEVHIHFGNGIDVSTPKFRPVDDVKPKA